MDVGIVAYLFEHEIGYIGSRDVSIGTDKHRVSNLVFAGARCVDKSGRAHDGPVKIALMNELFLAYMIHKHSPNL